MRIKLIRIDEQVHSILSIEKVRIKARTLNQVIKRLLEDAGKK